ncbi:serine hydrolase domain-containing protein [Glaciimonas immobilis]|uniref:CubicO group peptidase (Beta-lactamase class C family) n=1 Tax=Glaciimonas immobilis TaxID=728004 RepID=A0A840RR52_9BURK|nr:serine hydrolase domain-containing protein [Glaciimonas immobilis]KAF3997886.1 beta-lactamase family protein [Glaciimonas immobilis]MBB5199468.1 CubicO group peptidase (beta-lactamase class C family) [Glaciimonas immobilis]
MRQLSIKNAIQFVFVLLFAANTVTVQAQGLPVVVPETVGLSSAKLQKLKLTLQHEVDQGKFPGVVVMIARNGKLAYSEAIGYQDKAAGTPLKKDAIFRIYSMTKPLASVGAMMLVEDGKIQLTDPISKFLPEFTKMGVSVAQTDAAGVTTYTIVPANRAITVQDLLRHTSGIAYAELTRNPIIKAAYIDAGVYEEKGTDYDHRKVTPQQEVTGIAKAPLSTQPGSTWEYSMSVDILGRVVEAASGKMLDVYLKERLFSPLKMVDTGFQVPQKDIGRMAQPLSIDPATGAPNKLLDLTIVPSNASGGAGGVSTASDYLRFAVMMLQGGELNGQRILSPTTVSLMSSDHLGSKVVSSPGPGELLMGVPGYTFGLGFMVRQGAGMAGVPGSEGEYMWAGAAGTFFWIDPKQNLAVVTMMQSPGPSRPGYRRLIKQLVYAAINK